MTWSQIKYRSNMKIYSLTFFLAISIEEFMVEEVVWGCGGSQGPAWEKQLSPQQQQSLEATNLHPGSNDESWSLMVSVQSSSLWRETWFSPSKHSGIIRFVWLRFHMISMFLTSVVVPVEGSMTPCQSALSFFIGATLLHFKISENIVSALWHHKTDLKDLNVDDYIIVFSWLFLLTSGT